MSFLCRGGGGGGGRAARGTARRRLGGREQCIDLVARCDEEEVATARRAPRTGEGQRLPGHLAMEVVHLVRVRVRVRLGLEP